MDTYLVDTNVIVLMKRYTPRDLHPSLWQAVEALVSDGRLMIPREVLEELDRVEDELAPWAKRMDGFVDEPTLEDIQIVADISAAHPGWVVGQQNGADPWVVAQAYRLGSVIVTDERAKGPNTADKNLKIPNVAAKYNVECINMNDLGRREGWVF
ncbi:DUF4411 family protein [Rhodococcus sp. USK13]|uniref:DUF4411 family protein n=1 Tax=Rhodococcus sp. USK13 TaxID=2806442 RepID=UPI001BCF028B|nr:DUF4411 family protein [Rhodococcus sp. USK13]